METKALKKQLGAAIAMVIVAAIALGAATFAWFVNNTKVTAESTNVTASAANTLLISHAEEGKWGTTAAFKSTAQSAFVPVSTTDASSFFKSKTWTTDTDGAYNAETFEKADSSTDYYEDSFKVQASQNCDLYLDDETDFSTAEGVDADVLKAMRLALVVDGKAYFYQLDSDNIEGDGLSYNTTLKSLNADGLSTAIKSESTAGDISAENLSANKVIALSDGVVSAPSDTELAAADGNKKLCSLTANAPKDVKVLIWMEGCDYDCNSAVVKKITEQAITCKLGFCAGKTA